MTMNPFNNWLSRLRSTLIGVSLFASLTAPAAAGFFNAAPVPPAAIPGVAIQEAQYADPAEQGLRINNLEDQVRQLNGRLEEVSHQLQMLQNMLQRMQEDNEFRFQQLEGGGARPKHSAAPPLSNDSQTNQVVEAPADPGNGFSVADPAADLSQTADTGTYGAPPQSLGTLSGTFGADAGLASNSPVGGPLDLSAIARGNDNPVPPADLGNGLPGVASSNPMALPAPPNVVSSAVLNPPPAAVASPAPSEQLASLDTPASNDPRSAYEAAYAKIVSGDYEAAEGAFKRFIDAYPKDKQAGDAHYWLGESYYSRGQYRDAATSFLATYKDYPKSVKAPDSLYKLGLSLEGLGENSAACATFGELIKKYPKAQSTLMTRVNRERSKISCQ